MRRFTQTFVLVLQSPKKYYVRNDIFRYQDEIFSEDDAGKIVIFTHSGFTSLLKYYLANFAL